MLGDWVGPCSFAPGGPTDNCVWAPEVAAVDGGYALYYTARDRASGRQCIGVATSASPDGPFAPVGTDPLVCPTAEGGAIDASTYVEDGQRYLLWKSDGNCCSLDTWLHIQPLSGDGRTLTGPPTRLIKQDQSFEGIVTEAPTLVKHGDTYVLVYSANNFAGGGYLTSYATASELLGPYTKSPVPLMTTELMDNQVVGPGGQDIVTAKDGSTKIVFHGWDPTYTYRAMYLRDLSWVDDRPYVEGAAVRYEAESGVVTDARVQQSPGASGDGRVGGMDFPTSSVTLEVYALRSGPTTLEVRFGNGSLDPGGYPVSSSHTVTVNDRSAGEVVYPHTGWGDWTTVDHEVRLQKGWNTVTLTKGERFAELDTVDVG